MAGHRIQRLNEQFKREISDILSRRVRDPRIGAVIVTGVTVTPDLSLARVYLRLDGDEEARREGLEALASAAPFVRRELSKAIRLRRIPELRFIEDRTLEHASRIEEILDEIAPPQEDTASETE